MNPRTIVVAPSFAPGHTLPHLAVARELIDLGHRVIFHAEPEMRAKTVQAGCEFWPSPVGDAPQRFARIRSTAGLAGVYQRLAQAVAFDLDQRLKGRTVDAFVTDALHVGAALIAERSGAGWATLATTPALFGRQSAKSAQALVSVTALRRALGMAPDRRHSIAQALSPQRVLLPWVPAFDGAAPPPAGVHVGPFAKGGSGHRAPEWLATFGRRRPGVLVSVSTAPFDFLQPQISHAVSETIVALNRMNVDAVMTLGHGRFAIQEAPAAHVRLAEFVPHELVVARAAVVVTHGGWGTLGRTLRAGVPTVVMPVALDQMSNAKRVQALGLGVAVAPTRVSATNVQRAIEQCLDARLRRAHQAFRRQFVSKNPERTAARLVLKLT